jgi:NAD(P)-dependent dehydrogenase (short-subunit alcohol dehydrogenase family)
LRISIIKRKKKKEKRTFIITGGNSGLGRQCAKNIALERAENYVIIASRKLEKSIQAAQELADATQNPNVHALPLDLAEKITVNAFNLQEDEAIFPI